MRIAVLGTGVAGRTLAAALAGRGHDVVVGTRDVQDTLARAESPSYAEWAAAHPDVRLVPFADAGAHAEVVVNATSGAGSLAALQAAAVVDGTVVLDASNPLDFSQGFPPTLSVANTDSLAEQLQRAFRRREWSSRSTPPTPPSWSTRRCLTGEHNIFVAGDDAAAKAVVTGLLGDLGWPAEWVLDLGGLRAARAAEMYLPMWLSLMGAVGSPVFNIRVVRG